MGIKNLKVVLREHKLLKAINNVEKNKALYVDFFSLFMAIAYSVTSTDMLCKIMLEQLNYFKTIAEKVTLFVDRGNIAIKTSLREKRKAAVLVQARRKAGIIDILERQLKTLDPEDFLYTEKKERITSAIQKNQYYLFLSNRDHIKPIVDSIFKSLTDIEIAYCDEIDAEFELCYAARGFYRLEDEWPAILSGDQDTLCLACVDLTKKIIYDSKKTYLFEPIDTTPYLVKLMILINGCDFFGGLYGIAVTQENVLKFSLFTEFTLDNILDSLITKKYMLGNAISMEKIETILKFISDYTAVNRDAYLYNNLPTIHIKDFLITLLYDKWETLKSTYALGPNILRNIYNIYCHKTENTPDINNMLVYYDTHVITIAAIKILLVKLNLRRINAIASIAVSDDLELFFSFRKSFYFNNKCVIKSPSKMINIDIE